MTYQPLDTGTRYLGIDVGNIKHYVVRSDKGILKAGRFTADEDIDTIISTWKPTAGVIDAMPNTFLANYVVDKYPFMKMSYFQENNNNPQTLVWWGEGDKYGIVYSHRDRILDQFLMGMIEAKWLICMPADADFRLYIRHFETLRRAKVINNRGIERYVWESTTGEDHFVFADLYSYLAMMGSGTGAFFGEITASDKESVLGADNVYDISKAFSDNNSGYVE